MKIVSWNCNGKFREKFRAIEKLYADIYIIQECENPARYLQQDYAEFSANHVWIGKKPFKGLGIFARPEISLKRIDWKDSQLCYFLPIRVNGTFNLLGVWACKPYIEMYSAYQSMHIDKYTSDMIIMGDFNSNKIWDKDYGAKRHSFVVDALNRIGLVSAYHFTTGDKQGEERQNTFYLYRHSDKGFHIDYCFIDQMKISSFQILEPTPWLMLSDHIPIVLEATV